MNNPNVFRANSNESGAADAPDGELDVRGAGESVGSGNSRNMGRAANTEVLKRDLDIKEDVNKDRVSRKKAALVGIIAGTALGALIEGSFVKAVQTANADSDNNEGSKKQETGIKTIPM